MSATVGRFTLHEVLGRGGMGVVHRATDASGGAFALKLVLPEHASDPRWVERFRREAAVASRAFVSAAAFVDERTIVVGTCDGRVALAKLE